MIKILLVIILSFHTILAVSDCFDLSWEAWSSCEPLTETGICETAVRRRKRSLDTLETLLNSFEKLQPCPTEQILCENPCNGSKNFHPDCPCPDGYFGTCCEQVVTCGPPPTIPNGRVKEINTKYGQRYGFNDVVVYTCEKGYNMTTWSNGSLYCDKKREWSGRLPECLYAESCSSNPCKNNGKCTNFLGSYICSCFTGWFGIRCQNVVECEEPKPIDHGSFHKWSNKYVYNYEITYTCDKDYNMTTSSNAKSVCTEIGQWSGVLPKCLYAESCRSKPCVNNGTCTNLLDSYTCTCTVGWTGKHCEKSTLSHINVVEIHENNIAAVVGGVLGVLCFCLVLALILISILRRKKKEKSGESTNSNDYVSPVTVTSEVHEYSTIDMVLDTHTRQRNDAYENERIAPF